MIEKKNINLGIFDEYYFAGAQNETRIQIRVVTFAETCSHIFENECLIKIHSVCAGNTLNTGEKFAIRLPQKNAGMLMMSYSFFVYSPAEPVRR